MMSSKNSGEVIVESLYNAGVRIVFGIPGAKVDSIFNALADHPEIRLIVCRHEQNAAFMAAVVGRLTGRPGVCIATSGPGASNLTTGLATATHRRRPCARNCGNSTSIAVAQAYSSIFENTGPSQLSVQICVEHRR